MTPKLLVGSVILTVAFVSSAIAQATGPAPVLIPATPSTRSDFYYKTELYMGMSVPGGGTVSETAWEDFLSEIVTPRFPAGFTVLDGRGQYREASGTIAKEPSHVLVFLYKKSERRDARSKIEEIRNEYKRRFSQESVLRVDSRKTLLVSF